MIPFIGNAHQFEKRESKFEFNIEKLIALCSKYLFLNNQNINETKELMDQLCTWSREFKNEPVFRIWLGMHLIFD